MDPETKQKINELYELTQENNKILRKLRSGQRWATITRIVYWGILIALSVGAFYYIQPYLNQLIGVYTKGADTLDKVQNFGSTLPNMNDISGLLDQLTK